MQFNVNEELINNKSFNLLLVEDNEADIKITLEAMRRGKFQNKVIIARDGQEALDALLGEGKFKGQQENEKPHFVLMDIRMPGMDGFMTLERIRADKRLKHVPVAMLTTSNNQEDIAKSYELGAVGFLQKPDTYEHFISLIDCFNVYWKSVSKIPKVP